MPDLATLVVIALCALLTGWYAVGWYLNRRRGERLLAWMVRDLRSSGDQTTVARLGTSGFQVNVSKARAPFKAIEATVLLQSREVLLLWIVNRLRGRTDSLVLRCTLRTPPRADVEVVNENGPLAKRLMKGINETGWSCRNAPGGLIVAFQSKAGQRQADAISHLLQDLSPRLVRLSLSKKAPHLLANLSLAGVNEQTAALLISSVRDVAQAVIPGSR